jgi:hypothetical protein
MSIESDISTALNGGTPAITAYPLEAPQNAVLPYVVYRRISTMRHDTIQGAGTIEQARIQFNCYAASYSACKTLATAFKNRMATAFGPRAVHLHESDETDDGQHWIWIDFSVWSKAA